jgi:UDP:flavonoid glycosyltransferase YjiC (YdhE family)
VGIERFIPHTPVLARASCVVCHAGMGITQKALAHGLSVVAIPFGRDQPEVARRVEVAQADIRLPARKLHPAHQLGAVRHAIELRPGAQRIAAAFASLDTPKIAASALEQLAATNAAKTGAQPVA